MCHLVWHNPNLEGILDLKGYHQENDVLLKKLIGVISRYRLTNLNDLDGWSRIYEYLLERFPEKNKGIKEPFYTPRDVVNLMSELLEPDPPESFYDPACGSGCLSGLFHSLNLESAEQNKSIRFVGQDQFSLGSAVEKIDLLLYDTVKLYNRDALEKPLYEEDGGLKAFDFVFANPPWNLAGLSERIYT
jgi:type I restriction enzyme M protein